MLYRFDLFDSQLLLYKVVTVFENHRKEGTLGQKVARVQILDPASQVGRVSCCFNRCRSRVFLRIVCCLSLHR